MTEKQIIKAINKVDGIGGMTVNERLWTTELSDEFDKCLKTDKQKARRILELLKVDQPSIDLIVKD